MIGSENNGEAANAGLKATAILKKHDFTWAELLRKQVATVGSSASDDGPAPAPDTVTATNMHIQKCLDTLRGTDLGKVQVFFNIIDKRWSETGYLTIDQRKGLFNIYDARKR